MKHLREMMARLLKTRAWIVALVAALTAGGSGCRQGVLSQPWPERDAGAADERDSERATETRIDVAAVGEVAAFAPASPDTAGVALPSVDTAEADLPSPSATEVAAPSVDSAEVALLPLGSAEVAPPEVRVTGHVSPDFCLSSGCSAVLKRGFRIQSDDGAGATTDADGAFQLYLRAGVRTLTVSRPWYLTRRVEVKLQAELTIATAAAPITMWSGDIDEDGSVSMADVELIKASFNQAISDPGYVLAADLNCDGAVNMTDVGIAGRHLGESSEGYPPL